MILNIIKALLLIVGMSVGSWGSHSRHKTIVGIITQMNGTYVTLAQSLMDEAIYDHPGNSDDGLPSH
jgi:hypothetical protein